ncbi:MAG: TonB-dependent receptor, partial [Bacteroidales bacterium]|nr:TonB-dependent receptor [Bacteroidales bacterium]
LFSFVGLKAEGLIFDVPQDTSKLQSLNEVIITSSTKETNNLQTLPASVSFLTPVVLEGRKIVNVKDLSAVIPNFFIPDYGSKLSVPIYIRGIGERSTGQSIGMYMDNMPYLNKSVFDFEFLDISQIEILRGPQGTLYGRNAMSGMIHIRTHSPLHSQYGKISLTTGNYGLFRARVAASELIRENLGLTISGYYDGNSGYFTNQYNGKKADKLRSAGARMRLDWKINPNWEAQLTGSYDKVEQGAFPYGVYTNGNTSKPNYNSPGDYSRQIAGGSFNLKYENSSILINSNTGFLYFDDDMKMDLDYSPASKFRINQLQSERSWTEELTIRSNTNNNYQWSFGIFGFYNDLKTNVVTTMEKQTLAEMQQGFTILHERDTTHRVPLMTITDSEIPIPGLFKTPSYGGAIFHQSTYNNLFIEGLSAIAGVRLDYEKVKLNYDTHMHMHLDITKGVFGPMHIDSTVITHLQGKHQTSFTEILPKIALKYEFDPKNYIYGTVSNGYKAGGYNIQSFADIIRDASQKRPGAEDVSVIDLVSYKPEYSWNYEVGFKGELVKDYLFTEVAFYCIAVKDIQITDFVESGQGRILKNAGKAKSVGFDLSLSAFITPELSFYLNYGFTRATFKDYKKKEQSTNGQLEEINYSGNYIPFAPQNTLSLSGVYMKNIQNKWIDSFNMQVHYNAVGKIYWTEENDISQDIYGLLNARIGVNKGILGINFWASNLLNTKYTAFYFESLGQNLAQSGKPFTFGVDVNLSF